MIDCTACGACCASFRVDFSVHEHASTGGSVPQGLATPLHTALCRMNGTDHSPPRCAALSGRVGVKAVCGIYEWRPSVCQEFAQGSAACQLARKRHGLAPLSD